MSEFSEKTALRKIRKSAKLEQEERLATINVLISSASGRSFLWWLLDATNLTVNPFKQNALATSFSCGEMNVGQRILAEIIEANPAGYVLMLQERNDVRNSNRTANDDYDSGDADDN